MANNTNFYYLNHFLYKIIKVLVIKLFIYIIKY